MDVQIVQLSVIMDVHLAREVVVVVVEVVALVNV